MEKGDGVLYAALLQMPAQYVGRVAASLNIVAVISSAIPTVKLA